MGSVDFNVFWVGGLLVVQVSGLFNPKAAALLRQVGARALAERQAVKALLDMRRAVILFDSEQLAEMTAATLEAPIHVATGVLIDPAHEKLAWQHCMAMAQRGHSRYVFTDVSRALKWAGVPVPQLRPTTQFAPLSEPG